LQSSAAQEEVGHQEIHMTNAPANRNAQTQEEVGDVGGVTFQIRILPPNELEDGGFERSRHLLFAIVRPRAPRLLFFQIFVSTDFF
jgi:hypothetical protein